MRRMICGLAVYTCLLATACGALAQKSGGILRMYSPDSPATLSIHEEATVFSMGPMMGVFNNLVLFDQHAKQNNLDVIMPDLALSWSWNADMTMLTFPLRQDVRWHDGKPFTAKDVVCTYDLLLERATDKLRLNPRKATFENLNKVTAENDYQVTFHLKRPQPAFPMLIAGATGAIYPCHVSTAEMRRRPVGTGPFKFQEFRPNEYIRVVRNQDYWKPGLPYLDGIDYLIIRNPSTATLAFVSGQVDMTFPYDLTIPLLKDVQRQVPDAICEVTPAGGVNRHLLINRSKPPFDNVELRHALALSLDRQAFITILSEGEGEIGGVLQPPPGGLWGMPPEMLKTLPGYEPDIARKRQEARAIVERLGYGPNNRLKLKVTTRDIPVFRNPAIILLDHLKEIYIDGELEVLDTSLYYPRIYRRDFTVGLNLQTSGPDPDPVLQAFYGCGSALNWDGYCDADMDRMIEAQSREADRDRRLQLVWSIERKLAEDGVRPIIFYTKAATCWRPHVKNLTLMVNSIFSGNRREDIWLDR